MKSVRVFSVLVAAGVMAVGLCVPTAVGAPLPLVQETFSHPDGGLVGQTPTPGPGAAWAAHSGAGNKPIQVSSGEVTLTQSGGSGEDVNTAFSARSGQATTYARFDFRLPGGQTVDPDADGLYFAHFKDDGFFFKARTGVLSPTAAGDFALAINAESSNLGAGATWPSDLSFDTTYRVVISFNAATAESKLWLDPVDESSASISHTGTFLNDKMSQFAFRQSNDYTGSQIVDNLVVGRSFKQALTGIPEPSSVVLMLLGTAAIGLIGYRKNNCKRT